MSEQNTVSPESGEIVQSAGARHPLLSIRPSRGPCLA